MYKVFLYFLLKDIQLKDVETIKRHRELLEEHMDPDSGFLDVLIANWTLSWKEISKVKDKSPFWERNSQLLDYILEKRQGDGLNEALRETEQLHIVNYLSANGGKCTS